MENFTFDKIEYVRPDIDKAEELCKEYTAKLRAAKSYEEVKQIILDYDKSGEEMETMFTVAHIRNTLNTTDKFYEDEMAFLHQRLPVAQATFTEYAKLRNPEIEILYISAKTGEGIPALADWIIKNVNDWNK